MTDFPPDKSNGYEEIAEAFITARNPQIGVATLREWSKSLPRGCAILDLGCGHGVPVAETLIEEGFTVYGVDASAKLIAAFRARFPNAPAECAAVEDSQFFERKFDAVIACGLLFLLSPDLQSTVIHKVGQVLKPGGHFAFTAPAQVVIWPDSLTKRDAVSLGREKYLEILRDAGLKLIGESLDEGRNHYYFAVKENT